MNSSTPGTASSPEISEARAKSVEVSDERIVAELIDGRTISIPTSWYPRLARATPAQRSKWELIGTGIGIHWPDVDEDLSVEALLLGLPAHPSEFRRFGMAPPKRGGA